MPKTKSKWKLISEYAVTEYQCGARAGDRVRLRHDIVVRDYEGKPTGGIHQAGEVWTVLSGAAESTVAVWLRQLDGRRHTWDDNSDFWEWFEKIHEQAD